MMVNSHLIVDANDGMMKCLDCGDSHPLGRARMKTVIEIIAAFERAHNEMGCTEESYLNKKLLEDIDEVELRKYKKTGKVKL